MGITPSIAVNTVSIEHADGKKSGDDTDWWLMFRHDLLHTGYSTSNAPDTNNVLWSYKIGAYVQSSPAVAYGKVYIGSNNDKVYCLDANTGGFIWSYPTGGNVYSSPAVADGRVYFGSWDDNVYCLDAITGAYIWSYTTGDSVVSSPAVADGIVYIGSKNFTVYAFGSNSSPDKPTITGQTSGEVGVEYEYTFHASDPDGDNVKYYIDWDDNNTEWTDFNASGTDVMVKHSWSEDGTYNIMAKAQDIHGYEGPEGTLTVTMPRNKATTYSLFQLFFERFPFLEVIFLRAMNLLK